MVEEGQESLIDTLVNKVSYAHVEIFFFFGNVFVCFV